MVFVKDFKKEFYDVVLQKRVLILAAVDVDAVCACKIIQYLFQCDHILYTIVPIPNRTDLEKAFVEHHQGVKYIILINCGASEDIIEKLQPEQQTVFFICDSHRPVEVHNVYNQVQVKLLMKEDDADKIPEFDKVFREDESDNASDDSGGDDGDDDAAPKRQRFDAGRLEKRISRRRWDEERKKIIFEYEEFAYHGISSAFLMYEMAWKMSKDTNDLLWLAIIGVTEQYICNKVDRDHYMERVGELQNHVRRLNKRPEDDEQVQSITSLRLSMDQSLQLILYRHWTLFNSLTHSPLSTSKFKLWTLKGKKRMHEFLADMGLPLVQSHQKFQSMEVAFKENIKDMMKEHMEKYRFTEEELFVSSFSAHYGFRHQYSAADLVYACQAALEPPKKDLDETDSFLAAQDVLNRSKPECAIEAVEQAKLQLTAIVSQVQTLLDTTQVSSVGAFIYAYVQENTPDSKFFCHPIGLVRLARFTLEAYVAIGLKKKAKSLPLVMFVPLDNEKGTVMAAGIPPLSDDTCRNCFGKVFEQAATHTNARVLPDFFEKHIVELKVDDQAKFVDALISLLQ